MSILCYASLFTFILGDDTMVISMDMGNYDHAISSHLHKGRGKRFDPISVRAECLFVKVFQRRKKRG